MTRRGKVSNIIATLYVMRDGTSLCEHTNRNKESRVHLLHGGMSECGSVPAAASGLSSVTLPAAIEQKSWCYSCLGNALEIIERESA